MHDRLPLHFDVSAWPVLIVGGGEVGARRAAHLLAAGAVVTAVAPAFSPAFRTLEESYPEIVLKRRGFADHDLAGARLVVAATDDPLVNRRVRDLAVGVHVPVNVADDPAGSDFHFAALIRRGDLVVSIGAGGAPALVKELRGRIEGALPVSIGDDVAAHVAARRARLADPGARETARGTLRARARKTLSAR